MERKDNCKGCSASVRMSQDDIEKAIEQLSRIKKIKFVDDVLYENRLEKCNECRYLEYGTTCLQCGCVVQIKAKLADSSCPYPKDKKW